LLAEALDLERQVSEMQLTLGIKKRLSISSQWRKVVILVKRRLQRGVVFDPLEEMEGMVSSWPSDKLLPYIATLKERQAFLHMSVGHRREQFKRACAQWLELGLKANDPLIDLEQGDLTDDRFESIVRGMEQRKANAESSIKTLLQQVELLWERVPTDRGRKIKLRAAAMSGAYGVLFLSPWRGSLRVAGSLSVVDSKLKECATGGRCTRVHQRAEDAGGGGEGAIAPDGPAGARVESRSGGDLGGMRHRARGQSTAAPRRHVDAL
jgi:hypothetical protein